MGRFGRLFRRKRRGGRYSSGSPNYGGDYRGAAAVGGTGFFIDNIVDGLISNAGEEASGPRPSAGQDKPGGEKTEVQDRMTRYEEEWATRENDFADSRRKMACVGPRDVFIVPDWGQLYPPLRVLSDVLQTNIKYDDSPKHSPISGKAGIILWISKSEMPTSEEGVPTSMSQLYRTRLQMLESTGLLLFSIVCYNRCTFYQERLRRKDNLDEFLLLELKHVKLQNIHTIMTELESEYNNDTSSGGLYPNISENDSRYQYRSDFLNRLGQKYSKGEDQISTDCLKDLFDLAEGDKSGNRKKALYSIFLLANETIKSQGFQAGESDDVSVAITACRKLFKQTTFAEMMADTLVRETSDAQDDDGIWFEENSILGPILRLSALPQTAESATDQSSILKEEMCHEMWIAVAALFQNLCDMPERDVLVRWVSMLLNKNKSRVIDSELTSLLEEGKSYCCSHGFMVNFFMALSDVCIKMSTDDWYGRISPVYWLTDHCLLDISDPIPAIGGGEIRSEIKTREDPLASAPGYTVISNHIFHLTVVAFHVGIAPVILDHTRLKLQNDKEFVDATKVLKERFNIFFGDAIFVTACTTSANVTSKWITHWLQNHIQMENDVDQEVFKMRSYTSIPELYLNNICITISLLPTDNSMGATMEELGCALISRFDVAPLAAMKMVDYLNGIVDNGGLSESRKLSMIIADKFPKLYCSTTNVDIDEEFKFYNRSYSNFAKASALLKHVRSARRHVNTRLSCETDQDDTEHLSMYFPGGVLETLGRILASLCEAVNIDYKSATEDTTIDLSTSTRVLTTMLEETLTLLEELLENHRITSAMTEGAMLHKSVSIMARAVESIGCLDELYATAEQNHKDEMSKLSKRVIELFFRLARGCDRRRKDGTRSDILNCMAKDDDHKIAPANIKVLRKMIFTPSKRIGTIGLGSDFDYFTTMVKPTPQSVALSYKTNLSSEFVFKNRDINVDESSLATRYQQELGSANFGQTKILEDHCYLNYTLNPTINNGDGKVERLREEMPAWRSQLPVAHDSSIFLRQHPSRLDVLRAVITGPVGTVYSRGCFTFDIYCPPGYPKQAPFVKHKTTGHGIARLSPKFGVFGAVELPLLQSDWQPGESNIYEVLVAIQKQIFLSEPFMSDDMFEETKTKLRRYTVRYAILDVLKRPPKGFEDVIGKHFSIHRAALLKQCAGWLVESSDYNERSKLWNLVQELRVSLD